MGVVLIIVFLAVVAAPRVGRWYLRRRADQADGVVAWFRGLRLTPTELLDGYGRRKTRHRVAELTATVSDTGNGPSRSTVHLTITGPTSSIVHTYAYWNHQPTGHNARAFAERINLAARTAQRG